MAAVWIRFDTGWITVTRGSLPRLMYVYAAAVITLLTLFIFRALELYKRPQYGHFSDKVPRIIRACGLGIILATVFAFAIQHELPLSRLVTGIAFGTVTLLVLIERNILHQLERHWAKYEAEKRNVIILGTNDVAARLRETFESEPRRRARVVAFLRTDDEPADPAVPPALIRGSFTELPALLDTTGADEVLLANPSRLNHQQLGDIVVECERRLADFHMVPDMFSLLTSRVDVQTLDGIPLLGVSRWPLDFFWNRAVKRLSDLAGSLIGLLLFAPVMALAALAIRLTSPGPVFYMQERCGEKGQVFRIWKLRTMKVDAESESGPVWTVENDPRRTRVGGFLRRWNIDELPQFWNVLTGDMSLVGPRPERPHFVDQFKEDIQRYMQRHAHKPGMTGWAQVNGLRGNTSIHDRIKYDLFYLENWSLALDFKIILRTLVSTRNAY